MTKPRAIILMFLAALLIQACYSSNPPVNEDAADDAVTDTVHDDAMDVPPDDVIPDPVPDDSIFDDQPEIDPDAPPAPYSLHEWGVMLMDGEGATAHGPSPEFAGPIPAKPVIYLYGAPDVGPLNIGVNFATGAATEVWPEIPLGQRIAWNGLSITDGDCLLSPFPVPWDGGDPIDGSCEACALGVCLVEDASCLSFTDPATGGPIVSSLLFYTGRLPGYAAPLSAAVTLVNGPDLIDRLQLSVSNNSPYNIDGIWFIYRQTSSTCVDPSLCPISLADIAFSYIGSMDRGSGTAFTLDIMRYEAPVDEYGYPIGDLPLPQEWLDLGKDLGLKLVEKGLTEAETGAFLRSWQTIFFGLMGSDSYYIEPLFTNGAAIMYFMDRADYDSQLQLQASPPPSEIVRVGMVYQQVPFGI